MASHHPQPMKPTRYRAEGCWVYQGDTVIIACRKGDQGQKPEAIAQRVAELLNADFQRFCEDACHAAAKEPTE